MKKIYYRLADDGFYGCYWPNPKESRHCILAQLGDNVDDMLAKCGVKYFHDRGLNVMAMSPGKNDYSHHNMALERFGRAIEEARKFGNEKFAITGASTTGMGSLIAASYYPEITLTIAMTPSDWVMEGFYRDGLDGCGERPGDGTESTFTWQGRPLPFWPFCYRHPEFFQKTYLSAKEHGDRDRSIDMFDKMEAEIPLTEEMMIKIENIKGHIVFFGAEDDVMWNTVRYIKRMEKRLSEREHECTYESHIYEHCTHFVFPEGLFRKAFPGAGTLMTKIMFKAGKDYPKECKEARKDIDNVITSVISKWIDGCIK